MVQNPVYNEDYPEDEETNPKKMENIIEIGYNWSKAK